MLGTQQPKKQTGILLSSLENDSIRSRFPGSPLEIRVPFFLLFGFNKGTQKAKGQKGGNGKPRIFETQNPKP